MVEAITENPKIKKETYTAIDSIVKKDAIFASNTSSLTITELSMATARPKQFVGLHFFNPVPLMKLVEVVRTILTSDEAFNTAFEFAKSVGKDPVSCRDNSGFIVNRLLVPYLLDACRSRRPASRADGVQELSHPLRAHRNPIGAAQSLTARSRRKGVLLWARLLELQ